MKKRVLMLIVIACMLVALLPVSVLAGETTVIPLTQAVVDGLEVNGDGTSKSLDCSNYARGTIIRLMEDIVMPEGVALSVQCTSTSETSENGMSTLDMNGHTLLGDLWLGDSIRVTGNGVVTGETQALSGGYIESGTFLGTVYGQAAYFFLTGGTYAGGLPKGAENSNNFPTIYGGSFCGTPEDAQTAKGSIYGGTFYGDILDKVEKGCAKGPVVTYMDGGTVYARQVVLPQRIEEISKNFKMLESTKEALNANVGRAIMPVDPVRPGYRLIGWFTEDGRLWNFDDQVTEAMTLYADWTVDPAILGAVVASLPFTDVTSTDWFYSDVEYAYETGLMTGTSGTAFSPEAPVTRGMVMTILARREGVRTDRYTPWYAAGCEWAKANGISDGTNPEAPVTREQLAAMLYRYATLKGRDLTAGENLNFTDASDISDYAYPALQWACGEKILTGSNGALHPQSTATRAHLAAILHRYFG